MSAQSGADGASGARLVAAGTDPSSRLVGPGVRGGTSIPRFSDWHSTLDPDWTEGSNLALIVTVLSPGSFGLAAWRSVFRLSNGPGLARVGVTH